MTPPSDIDATLGIDLASQPASTALCAIEWGPSAARVAVLCKGRDVGGTPLHDELLVSVMRGLWGGIPTPAKVAIDAPLGWPVDFVRAVSRPSHWPVGIDDGRERLVRRATDHWVHRETGKLPLSVSTDRIAYPAMRAAGLLSHYAQTFDEPIDVTGVTGLVCEAYPDPAIRRFGLWPDGHPPRASYKADAHDLRVQIVGQLLQRAPWLEISLDDQRACAASDDLLDALVCALVARAAQKGLTKPPPAVHEAEARTEGWIHLPDARALEGLL